MPNPAHCKLMVGLVCDGFDAGEEDDRVTPPGRWRPLPLQPGDLINLRLLPNGKELCVHKSGKGRPTFKLAHCNIIAGWYVMIRRRQGEDRVTPQGRQRPLPLQIGDLGTKDVVRTQTERSHGFTKLGHCNLTVRLQW